MALQLDLSTEVDIGTGVIWINVRMILLLAL